MREQYDWVIVEQKVKRKAAVEVSKSTHTVPRYMFRLGTPRTGDNGDTYVSSRISIYSVGDAIDLLNELSEKYQAVRDHAQERHDQKFHRAYTDEEAPVLVAKPPPRAWQLDTHDSATTNGPVVYRRTRRTGDR